MVHLTVCVPGLHGSFNFVCPRFTWSVNCVCPGLHGSFNCVCPRFTCFVWLCVLNLHLSFNGCVLDLHCLFNCVHLWFVNLFNFVWPGINSLFSRVGPCRSDPAEIALRKWKFGAKNWGYALKIGILHSENAKVFLMAWRLLFRAKSGNSLQFLAAFVEIPR